MSPVASPVRARPDSRPPALRLLPEVAPEANPEPLRAQEAPRPALRVLAGPTRVLVAGADARRRATLRDELTKTLPASTVFDRPTRSARCWGAPPPASWRSSPATSTTHRRRL
jgi:hypothetical protein